MKHVRSSSNANASVLVNFFKLKQKTNLEFSLFMLLYYVGGPAQVRLNWPACGPQAKMSSTPSGLWCQPISFPLPLLTTWCRCLAVALCDVTCQHCQYGLRVFFVSGLSNHVTDKKPHKIQLSRHRRCEVHFLRSRQEPRGLPGHRGRQ